MNAERTGSASGGADGRWRVVGARAADVGAEGGSETLPYGFWKG